MWPLLLCSILGVAFIIERAIAYSRIKGDTAEIFSSIRESLLAGTCVALSKPARRSIIQSPPL